VGYISNKEVQQSDLQGFVAGGVDDALPELDSHIPSQVQRLCLLAQ
jgi:hypothetical protein